MIASLFLGIFIIAVIIFLLGVKEESIVYHLISLMMFVILMAQSIYITIPFIAVTNSTTYTMVEHQYMETGIGAFCLVFILTDVILLIVEFMDWRKRRRGPAQV